LLRTFRERRDHYLKVLEEQTKLLHANEAHMLNEVERLRLEVGKLQSKLEEGDGGSGKFKRYATTNGVHGLETTMQSRQWYSGDPPENTTGCSQVLVWTEYQKGQPHSLHVNETQDAHSAGFGNPLSS
jgi:hypothetical protein